MAVGALPAACDAYSGRYFEPSASTGTVGYPRMAGSSYGLFPKNTLYFSQPDYPVISIRVSAWCDHSGNPIALWIDVEKLYFSDPYFRSLPYEQALKEIARDRTQVVADSSAVEIDWADGQKQIAPLAFPGQRGTQFVISGDGQGPGHPAIVPRMEVKLANTTAYAFDVKIPAMTISGHRLEIPVIHFRRID